MTSFEKLLSSVGKTEGQALPTPKALLARNEEVVAYKQFGEEIITVFSSGFLIFERGKRYTVFAVDRCRYLCFGETKIQRSEFADWEWFHPILQICNLRIDENIEAEKASFESSYSVEDIDILYSKGLVSPIEDEDEDDKQESIKDIVEKALSPLTYQQREIFKMVVLDPTKEYSDIAKELGISNPVQVCKQYHTACKKLGITPIKKRK